MSLNDVALEDALATIATTDDPVVLDFWAPDCGRCLSLRPQLERTLDQLSTPVVALALNTRDDPQISEHFGVLSLPTVVIYHQGAEQRRFTYPVLTLDVADGVRGLSPNSLP